MYRPTPATRNVGYGYNTHSQEFYADLYPSACGASAGPWCMACFLPCIAAGQVTKAAGSLGGGTVGFCLGCLLYNWTKCLIHGCFTAQALRRKFPTGIEESACYTCLCHLCASCCALSRELQYIQNLRAALPDADWLFKYWDKAKFTRADANLDGPSRQSM